VIPLALRSRRPELSSQLLQQGALSKPTTIAPAESTSLNFSVVRYQLQSSHSVNNSNLLLWVELRQSMPETVNA